MYSLNSLVYWIICLLFLCDKLCQGRSQAGAKAGNACIKNQSAFYKFHLVHNKLKNVICLIHSLQTCTICHGQISRLTRIA